MLTTTRNKFKKIFFTVFVIQLICNSKISIKQHLAYKSVRIDIVIQFSLWIEQTWIKYTNYGLYHKFKNTLQY